MQQLEMCAETLAQHNVNCAVSPLWWQRRKLHDVTKNVFYDIHPNTYKK